MVRLFKTKLFIQQAFSIVCVDNIEEIWCRLENTFGDAQILLRNKFRSLDKIGGLWRIKGDEKLIKCNLKFAEYYG